MMETIRDVFEKNFVPVGATFTVDCVEYIVQEADSCEECACCDAEFGCLDDIRTIRFPMCTALLRKDGKEVIFKRVR